MILTAINKMRDWLRDIIKDIDENNHCKRIFYIVLGFHVLSLLQ